VWHRAAEQGSLQALEKLWSWSKEEGLKTVKMNIKLLLAKNKFGQTAWDIATTKPFYNDVSEKLCEIAKEAKMILNEY
jgi:hypothetical protein